ncbi:MAG: RNA methyltransferase [Nitratireductor sp.]
MAGTDRVKPMLAEGPAIILVEPQLGENIGMVARAMANFGLSDLRLVNPRDGWPSEKARAVASRADHVIDAVTVFATLEEAIADLHHVYATTARPRDMIKEVIGPEEAARRLRSHHKRDTQAGILFGRERWGLENHEVALCDSVVTFPVNPAFASLNIAQATLLMAWEWMKSGEAEASGFREMAAIPATRRQISTFLAHLEKSLDDAGYFFPEIKREKMLLTIRNMFSHAGLSGQEVRTLHGVVAALERRWVQRQESEETGEIS